MIKDKMIALIAHDYRKKDMIEWVKHYNKINWFVLEQLVN